MPFKHVNTETNGRWGIYEHKSSGCIKPLIKDLHLKEHVFFIDTDVIIILSLSLPAGQQNQAQSSTPEYNKAWGQCWTPLKVLPLTCLCNRAWFCVVSRPDSRSWISADLQSRLQRLGGLLQAAHGLLQPGHTADTGPGSSGERQHLGLPHALVPQPQPIFNLS